MIQRSAMDEPYLQPAGTVVTRVETTWWAESPYCHVLCGFGAYGEAVARYELAQGYSRITQIVTTYFSDGSQLRSPTLPDPIRDLTQVAS